LQGLGTVNEINIKEDYSNPKLSINKVGFAPLGEYKSVGYLNSKNHWEKYGFKLIDANKFPKKRWK
jgi:hypothetical protein